MIHIPYSNFPPGYIIVPTGVVPRFVEFYDALETLKVPEGTGRYRNSGPDCDSNRNRGVAKLLEADDGTLEWIAFLDDDQKFHPDLLMKMLGAMYEHNLDVLTPLYLRKIPPFDPVWFGKIGDDGGEQRLDLIDLARARKEGHIIPIDGLGAGFLVVRKRVFEQIEQPWFNPGPGRAYGGDVGFSQKLKKAGIQAYGLMEGIGHIMPCIITPVWNEETSTWQVEFMFGYKGFVIDAPTLQEDNAPDDPNPNPVC